jgi:hypothetical protein
MDQEQAHRESIAERAKRDLSELSEAVNASQYHAAAILREEYEELEERRRESLVKCRNCMTRFEIVTCDFIEEDDDRGVELCSVCFHLLNSRAQEQERLEAVNRKHLFWANRRESQRKWDLEQREKSRRQIELAAQEKAISEKRQREEDLENERQRNREEAERFLDSIYSFFGQVAGGLLGLWAAVELLLEVGGWWSIPIVLFLIPVGCLFGMAGGASGILSMEHRWRWLAFPLAVLVIGGLVVRIVRAPSRDQPSVAKTKVVDAHAPPKKGQRQASNPVTTLQAIELHDISLCGSANARIPTNLTLPEWSRYRCLNEASAENWAACLERTAYSDKKATGCPGSERCCP